MICWLTNNIGTIIVLVLLILVISATVISLINNKRKGKSTCGCNCAHCSMGGTCHKK